MCSMARHRQVVAGPTRSGRCVDRRMSAGAARNLSGADEARALLDSIPLTATQSICRGATEESRAVGPARSRVIALMTIACARSAPSSR